MKTFSVVLLVASLWAERALSLQCYKCENAISEQLCLVAGPCLNVEKFCVTLRNKTSGQEPTMSKWCATHCPKNLTDSKHGVTVECCEENYCNGNKSGGSIEVKANYVMMVMATLAILFDILCMKF